MNDEFEQNREEPRDDAPIEPPAFVRRPTQPPHENTGAGAGGGARPTGKPSQHPAAEPGPQPAGERQPAGGTKKVRVRRKYRMGYALLITGGVLAFCIFFAVFILRSASDLFGLNQPDQEIVVSIPKGATASQIADILKENGVIETPFTFRLYAKLKKAEDLFKPGEDYVFNSNMSYDQIIIALKAGTERTDVVQLTFPEGLTAADIGSMLEEEGVCTRQELFEALKSADYDYEFMDMLPESDLRFLRLEGYVFPDTYNFFVDENPESVAKKFLQTFDKRIRELDEEIGLYDKMRDLGMSLDEVVTLASVIQKEAGLEEEMYNVSSVFHNRLATGSQYPKLQSDVTIFYVEKVIKKNTNLQNQEMYDAYNTYVCNGLPVGPICNPGLAAIRAAVMPADTNYYFFVTDKEDQYYYATTAEEHYANVAQAEKVGDAHGTDVES